MNMDTETEEEKLKKIIKGLSPLEERLEKKIEDVNTLDIKSGFNFQDFFCIQSFADDTIIENIEKEQIDATIDIPILKFIHGDSYKKILIPINENGNYSNITNIKYLPSPWVVECKNHKPTEISDMLSYINELNIVCKKLSKIPEFDFVLIDISYTKIQKEKENKVSHVSGMNEIAGFLVKSTYGRIQVSDYFKQILPNLSLGRPCGDMIQTLLKCKSKFVFINGKYIKNIRSKYYPWKYIFDSYKIVSRLFLGEVDGKLKMPMYCPDSMDRSHVTGVVPCSSCNLIGNIRSLVNDSYIHKSINLKFYSDNRSMQYASIECVHGAYKAMMPAIVIEDIIKNKKNGYIEYVYNKKCTCDCQ